SCLVTGFRYLPRPGPADAGGRIKEYRAYVGDKLIDATPSADGPLKRSLPDKFYLMAYSTGTGGSGLNLAYSLNGYRWDVFNGGRCVLKSTLGDKVIRDPCLALSSNGVFHLVWSVGGNANYIGHASSRDLLHWSTQTGLPVMTNEPSTQNCLTPRIFQDDRNDEYLITWSSTLTKRASNVPIHNQIFCTRTRDFDTFAKSSLFYDPGDGATYGAVVAESNSYCIFFTDEAAHRVRMAVADSLAGPFGPPSSPIVPDFAWGPMPFQLGGRLVVAFSGFYGNYGAVRTDDMRRWENILPGLLLPRGTGPGVIMEVPVERLKPLIEGGFLGLDAASPAYELGLGDWIWTRSVADRQGCHLWRAFDIPSTSHVARAEMLLTADNSYTVYLDGRECGHGGDVNSLTEYDLTWLLSPGRHVLGIEAFNDTFDAGVILNLRVTFTDGKRLDVPSDSRWRIATDSGRQWLTRRQADGSWPDATVVGFASRVWWQFPTQIVRVPPLPPAAEHFWQRGWVLAVFLGALALSVVLLVRQGFTLALNGRARRMLERERARIARDMHDDFGSGLTQLTLLGELALREAPHSGETHKRLDELCAKARLLLRSMDEMVWTVNPRLDTVKDFAAYISESAQEFLASASIRCREEVMNELPDAPLDLPERRNFLLAIKEAIRNAARHSGSAEVTLKIRVVSDSLTVVVEDKGRGFVPAEAQTGRNGLANMKERLADIGGDVTLASSPGKGCRVTFVLPLKAARKNHE
ncbi:MAG TPA: ATP-binding protein, partial [Verrucomicrobiae bacterium]|nr:ATP-binding protein [Verrucomicrobiae bacterium]